MRLESKSSSSGLEIRLIFVPSSSRVVVIICMYISSWAESWEKSPQTLFWNDVHVTTHDANPPSPQPPAPTKPRLHTVHPLSPNFLLLLTPVLAKRSSLINCACIHTLSSLLPVKKKRVKVKRLSDLSCTDDGCSVVDLAWIWEGIQVYISQRN